MAFFSGTNGLIAKIVLLAGFNAIVVWAATVLATHHKWVALLVVAAAAAAIDVIYLIPSEKLLPAKFLIPGTIFLIAFTVIPIVYTINIAFTNYSTGHILSKSEAIDHIQLITRDTLPNAPTYTISPARDGNGNLVLLMVNDSTGKTYVGTTEELKPISGAKVSDGSITAAPGYKLIPPFSVDIDSYKVPLSGDEAIHPEGLTGNVEAPTLRYDAKTGTFTNIKTGVVYHDDGKGEFVSPAGTQLTQTGWKTYNGFAQFSKIVTDPLYRRPFLRVLLWTLVFSASTVLLSFALGLFFAITLQKKIRGQRVYRSLLVIPYAIPSFLTILVWAGLLTDTPAFPGVVNSVLHTNISWLFDPWWARVAVILVSVWLTFPYFFLVNLGALQSIPGDLVEAARVDGAGGWQVFRRITLPLLLVSTAPLMIASFAFNFNNFNNIYLLTGGGPSANDQSVAGSTDILISYTYKLAFSAGQGQQYSTAAAISIIIFLIVATISGILFWKTKALETLR